MSRTLAADVHRIVHSNGPEYDRMKQELVTVLDELVLTFQRSISNAQAGINCDDDVESMDGAADSMTLWSKLQRLKKILGREKRFGRVRLAKISVDLYKRHAKDGAYRPDTDFSAINKHKSCQSQLAIIIAYWYLHEQAICRIEDLLEQSGASDEDRQWLVWCAHSISALYANKECMLLLPAFNSKRSERTGRAIAHQMICHVVRLAFYKSHQAASKSFYDSHSVIVVRQSATRMIKLWFAFDPPTLSPSSVQIVLSFLQQDLAKDDKDRDRTLDPIAVHHFLREQLYLFLSSCSSLPTETADKVFDCFHSCLDQTKVLQVIKKLLSTPSNEHTVSVFENGTLKHVLEAWIKHHPVLVQPTLELCHSLAADGFTNNSSTLIHHCVYLLAAISRSHDGMYRQWMAVHFGAKIGSSNIAGGMSTASSVKMDIPCLRAESTCSIVTNVRHAHLLGNTLVAHDLHKLSYTDALDTNTLMEEIAVHLNILKSQMSKYPTDTTLSDLTSDTRAHFLQVQTLVQSSRMSVIGAKRSCADGEGSTGEKKVDDVPFMSEIQKMVKSEINQYKQKNKLSATFQQLRMFQAQKWKHEFLPCVLDCTGSRSALEIADHLSFVHALAEENYISTAQYKQFLSEVQGMVREMKRRRRDSGSSAIPR